MGLPQILVLIVLVCYLFENAAKHGKATQTLHSFWGALVNFLIWVAVLWWGGFWV